MGFFGRLVRKRPKKLSFQEEAMEKLSSVLGFNHPDAIKNLPVFEYKGDEYHPVVLDLTIYFLSSEGILPHIKKRERAKVIPLTSHIHAEKLQKRLA